MRFRHIAVVAAAAGALLAAGGAPAAAAPDTAGTRTSFVKVTGAVSIDPADPRVGHVRAVYRCTGTGALWASVKQVADRSRDPRLTAEGSSAIAEAWSDSHRNAVTCDGRVRTAVFTVDQLEPYFTENGPTGQKSDVYGPLRRGWGWTQLCLFDDANTEVPLSDMVFTRVVARR